jgi:ABC-2 type transport system permease protein
MTDQNLGQLSDFIDFFVAISPEQIVSPILQQYSNVRGQAFNTVIFHAPGLLALLIQHVAVSLGALALVRERLSGTFEIFRVTPVTGLQLLLGKYLAYTFFVVTIGLVLVVMMRFIGVPLPNNFLPLFGLILLLAVASLGIGFSLSLLSGSDSQAIQMTMLVLLFSVIFSGFFLSLDSFAPAAWIISLLLPMTYGIEGLQSLMLSDLPPDDVIWQGLAILALVTFGLVWLLTRRAFRQA